jgi:hypothetical protein
MYFDYKVEDLNLILKICSSPSGYIFSKSRKPNEIIYSSISELQALDTQTVLMLSFNANLLTPFYHETWRCVR